MKQPLTKKDLPKPSYKVTDGVLYQNEEHMIVGVIRATLEKPEVRYLLNGIGPSVSYRDIYPNLNYQYKEEE